MTGMVVPRPRMAAAVAVAAAVAPHLLLVLLPGRGGAGLPAPAQPPPPRPPCPRSAHHHWEAAWSRPALCITRPRLARSRRRVVECPLLLLLRQHPRPSVLLLVLLLLRHSRPRLVRHITGPCQPHPSGPNTCAGARPAHPPPTVTRACRRWLHQSCRPSCLLPWGLPGRAVAAAVLARLPTAAWLAALLYAITPRLPPPPRRAAVVAVAWRPRLPLPSPGGLVPTRTRPGACRPVPPAATQWAASTGPAPCPF